MEQDRVRRREMMKAAAGTVGAMAMKAGIVGRVWG